MLTTLLRQSAAGLRMLLVMTVLLGLAYPFAIYGVSRLPGLEDNAEGSIIEVDGRAMGSELVGIDPVAADPENDPYFHTRPSASAEDALGPGDPSVSGGSNLAADSTDLLHAITQRKARIAAREGVDPADVPADAVTTSASGVDPHISEAYATLQARRVARVTGLDPEKVHELIEKYTDDRALGFLGSPGVDVTELNLAIQRAAG